MVYLLGKTYNEKIERLDQGRGEGESDGRLGEIKRAWFLMT